MYSAPNFDILYTFGITISDMNKDRNRGNSQDKNDNIFIKLYENSKEKRKKRQRSEGEQKHRKIKPDRKPPSDTNNCYKMSSRPRFWHCHPVGSYSVTSV